MSVRPRPIHLPRRYLVLAAVSLAIGALAALAAQFGLPWQAASHAEILELDLRRALPDHTRRGADGQRSISAVDVLRALDEAARDPGILGVYLRVGGDGMALAQAQELADAVNRLRASGKFAVAFAPEFSAANLADRVLAAAADEIWLAPPGEDAGPSNKAALAKAELTGLPPERTAAWNALLAQATARIAGSPVTDAALRKTEPGFASGEEGDDAAPPRLRRGHEAHAERAALGRAETEGAFVSLPAYRDRMDRRTGPAIALIQAEGSLADDAAELAERIAGAGSDPGIAAIVVRLSLRGATPQAAARMRAALRGTANSGKPVAVSYGPMVPPDMARTAPPGMAMAVLPGALTMTGDALTADGPPVAVGLDGGARTAADLRFLMSGEAASVLSPGTALRNAAGDGGYANPPDADGFAAEAAAAEAAREPVRFGTLLDMRDRLAAADAVAANARLVPYRDGAEVPLLSRTRERLRNIRDAARRITITMP